MRNEYTDKERSRLLRLIGRASSAEPSRPALLEPPMPDELADIAGLDTCAALNARLEKYIHLGRNPYFVCAEGLNKNTCRIDGRELLNFNTYDYLDLNGHPETLAAGEAAARRYGYSASASRVGGGERPVHRELERLLADIYKTEDCVVFVSGHATNVATLSTLFGPGDVIFHDQLSHNSILLGSLAAHAARVPFPHNDMAALEQLLAARRGHGGRAVIVSEGLFSMDGSVAALPELIRLKRRHRAFLMLDEAHALGTLGPTGRGTWEHFGVDPGEVDIWMGTLSKTACGCGGYIAARKVVVDTLKYSAPSFVFSVGMSPPLTAATTAALRIALREPDRVERLRRRGRFALDYARARGLDTGRGEGHAVLPIMVGDTLKAFILSEYLFRAGVWAMPVVHPVVEAGGERLRFFLSAAHSEADIRTALDLVAKLLPKVRRTRALL